MVSGSTSRPLLGAPLRAIVAAAALLTAGVTASACSAGPPAASGTPSSGSPSGASSGAATAGTTSGSCSKVGGRHHAHLVVETSPGKILSRCVAFAGPSLPALALLAKSHVELGTQTYSFGVAICQVDHVPAHYSQCLPSGQDYWALFVSEGHRWTSPSVGVSEVKVAPGASLGLRYDSPTGTPAPPPYPGR